MSTRARHAAFAGLTHEGRSRSHNEDAFVATPPLFAVADGLGGHQAGEIASRIAIDTLISEAPTSTDPSALTRAVTMANRAILAGVEEGRGRTGMGTTITAAIVRDDRIVVAHVGDSRAYLLRGERLTRITRDHSLVGEMVRSGSLTEAQARLHPDRSVITRALGSRPEVQVDTYEVVADPGDRLLLCSDGLHAMIGDEEIETILSASPDAEEAVKDLVDAANDAGGMDNITAVVVEIGQDMGAISSGASGKRRAAIVLWLAALLFVLAATGVGVYSYARDRAYVVAEDGLVVVYRGLPGTFAGVTLSWHEQMTEIVVSELPDLTAERLTEGIRVEDLSSAMDLVAEYRDLVSGEATPTTGP